MYTYHKKKMELKMDREFIQEEKNLKENRIKQTKNPRNTYTLHTYILYALCNDGLTQ